MNGAPSDFALTLSNANAQAHAMEYLARLQESRANDVTLATVDGADHGLHATVPGAAAFRDLIIAECQ